MKLRWSDVTPRGMTVSRRGLIAGAAATLALRPALATDPMRPNTHAEISDYNNFIEFGFSKTDPKRRAGAMTTDPWSVEIGGLVERPGSYAVDQIAPANAVEERIYRMRCVEGWYRVVPWLGVPLGPVLARAVPRPSAKYVVFETLLRPSEMPMQRDPMIDWPYREGLRLDEAMHPLTLLATGLYGDPLPNQNGAPIRLVVPWKYGFKSIKSVVRITLTENRPNTSWSDLQPTEYGFFANVNPRVDHPRWSQATERRIGAGLLDGREDTPMFNGYAEQVAGMYAGMDLARDY